MGTEVLLSSPRTPFDAEAGCRGHASLTSQRWDFVVQGLRQSLASAGFDIVHPLSAAWYNEHVEETSQQLPASSPGGSTLAVLVGNTKNLWNSFQAAYEHEDALQQEADPLDCYAERCIQSAASSLGRPSKIFWAHEGTSMAINGPSTELQRMAALAGLTYWDESSGLSLHPKYGSWFALRAVLVFEGIEHTGAPPKPLQNPMSAATQAYLRMATRSARSFSAESLADISRSSSGELSSRRSSGSCDEPLTKQALAARWQRWAAVRDLPCPGHPWRYPPAMLQYHYTGDRTCLLSPKRR